MNAWASALDSIQAEIKERLDEIDRVSQETQFNGKYVLGNDAASLSVQVGAHDNQRINIELTRIDSTTLNLSSYNVNGTLSSDLTTVDTVGAGGIGTTTQTLTAGVNGIDPTSQPINSGVETDGKVYEIKASAPGGAGYAVKTEDGDYFRVTENTATGKWVWDSSDTSPTSKIADTNDIAGEATAASVYNTTFNSTTSAEWITTATAGKGTAVTVNGGVAVDKAGIDTSGLDASSQTVGDIYRDNTNGKYYVEISGGGADDGFYEISIGNDGKVATIVLDPLDQGALPNVAESEVVTANFTAVSINFSAGLFARNDTPAFVPDGSGNGGTQLFAAEGHDGNYYEVEATFTYDGVGDKNDAASYTIAFAINASPTATQVSAQNIGNQIDGSDADHQLTVSEGELFNPETDLYNLDLSNLPTAAGVYALKDGGYAVQDNNGDYYAGNVGSDGTVAWDSSTAKLDPDTVDVAGGPVTSGSVTVTGDITGLLAGEQLVSYEDAEGNLAYAVQSGTGNDAVYKKVTLGEADATTGNRAIVPVNDEDGVQETLSVRSDDPLKALDDALQQVDNLRSHLGAIQNRFESTIANLNNTVNNLSAARSRIEDTDYAVEVSNMTRAQILQQAGTSVLAQANQVPQTVLSLLR